MSECFTPRDWLSFSNLAVPVELMHTYLLVNLQNIRELTADCAYLFLGLDSFVEIGNQTHKLVDVVIFDVVVVYVADPFVQRELTLFADYGLFLAH